MMKKLRNHFKMLRKITYFDNAALCLKPDMAIKASTDFYKKYSVSVRTNNAPLGIQNIAIINSLRKKICDLLETNIDETKIIFTSGTTASLNMFALMIQSKLKAGDEILLSSFNHSSNFVPWIEISKKTGAKIIVKNDLLNNINDKTKVIAFAQMNNNFNVSTDMKLIKQKAESVGAIIVNDAAQAIVYEPVRAKFSDVIAFSCNKFYGPTGLGVLAIKNDLLKKLEPVFFGGGSVLNIDKSCTWIKNDSIDLFESGTANFAGIYMFDKALDFFNTYLGYEKTQKILNDLSNYAYKKLSKIPNIQIYTQPNDHIILFNIKGVDSHDIAHYLGTQNIYVRSGLFCAYYVRNIIQENSYVRVSLGVYNNKKEIRKLVDSLEKGGDFIVI
ncbi:aminotransferase class V-fold PLP-dependent enzyme [Mycoplasma sp. ES3157-GEN-MYC]|nr:aminotransferase class V-fold PLP-dependent enzyme [Mycoplasma miroungigenitalium]MBU4690316.1 aminotransferase class V-fold PLP-dependent enzyme [Mycoplasma miroungigenitalium]